MFKKLFGKHAAREKWEAGLTWFRLRYLEPAGPTHCINLLSRLQVCGRVALYYRPKEAVSQLYLGIPETHVRLLQRMMADFGFSLKPKTPEVATPAAQRMTAGASLPWDKSFVAHIVNEVAFVSLVGEHNDGSYFPQGADASGERRASAWQLPETPPAGLTLQPSWDGQPPTHLIATSPDPRCWLLGRTSSGMPLHMPGRVNIYGRAEAVAEWLVPQVTQMMVHNHANLVVLDGAGDLVPRLKRKTAVTKLLGDKLVYMDIDGTSLVGGFNPLAAVPGETDAEVVQRWQRWFAGMNVNNQGIDLLAQAQEQGVGDIPALRRWLKQVERHGNYSAVASLSLALNRLTASRNLREWLAWPATPYMLLPAGAFLLTCPGVTWERRQLLRSVLLSVMRLDGVRLVAHGVGDILGCCLGAEDRLPEQMLLSNGPLLPQSHLVFTENRAAAAERLAARFGHGNLKMAENLQLLGRREAAVLVGQALVFAQW